MPPKKKPKKKSDDQGRMRQAGLGIASRDPVDSTSFVSFSSISTGTSNKVSNDKPSSDNSFFDSCNEYLPNFQDRKALLMSTKSKNGRYQLLKDEKKHLLSDVLTNKPNINWVIHSVDKEGKRVIQKRFDTLIDQIGQREARNRASVEQIAKWIMSLRKPSLSWHPPTCFTAILDMMKKIDNQVRRDIYNDPAIEKNHQIELTPSQALKSFDKNLVPKDSSAVICPYYKHRGTLNFLEGHKKVFERNKRSMEEFHSNYNQ